MRKNKNSIKFNKIEVDDKTLEPKIVEISEEKFEKENVLQNVDQPVTAIDSENDEVQPARGQQIVMNKVFGMSESEKSVSKRQKFFKNLVTILFVVVVVGVLVFTFLNDFVLGDEKKLPSWTELSEIYSSTWFYILIALFALFLYYFFKGLKLSLMCKGTTNAWHFKTCMETAIVGIYYNNVTPLAVGGQPFEIYHLSKHGVKGGVAASLPIAAYFLNQFGFAFLGIASLICFSLNAFGPISNILGNVSPTTFIVLASVGLFFCLLLPTIVIIFSMRAGLASKLVRLVMNIGAKLRIIKNPEASTAKTIKTVEHNAKCLKQITTSPIVFILSICMSLAEHLALASVAYFTLKFFGWNDIYTNGFVEWVQVVHITIVLYAAISFVPTPGNAGASEISFYLIFANLVPFVGGAFSAMAVWRILTFYSTLIIGFTFTKTKKRADKKKMALSENNSGFTEYEVSETQSEEK